MAGNPIFAAQEHPLFYKCLDNFTWKDDNDVQWLKDEETKSLIKLDGYAPVPEAYARLNDQIDRMRGLDWEDMRKRSMAGIVSAATSKTGRIKLR